MRRYDEEEIAAEEKRIGRRLPDEVRNRLLDGIEDVVVLQDADGDEDEFEVLGPSTIKTDKKGRSYPTSGMHQETEEVRSTDEDFLPREVAVGWARAANGDLAVVLRDGTLGWWRMAGGEIVPATIDWDPAFED